MVPLIRRAWAPLSVQEKEVFLLGRTAFGLATRVQLVAFAYENGLVR